MSKNNGFGKVDVEQSSRVTISAPNLKTAMFTIVGTSPYVQHKFSEKAKRQMREKQMAGGTANKVKKRDPRDFKADYEAVQYKPAGAGWPNGAIPATQIKAAMIAACRLVDFKMTEAKQCFWVEQDGLDVIDGKPLIKMSKGQPRMFEQSLPNSNGKYDLRVRPMWDAGWECQVRITYDADRFTLQDVANLLARAGAQVGIGEGRMASKHCAGVGWGAFRVKESHEVGSKPNRLSRRAKTPANS